MEKMNIFYNKGDVMMEDKLYQYETPLFKKHTLIDSQTAIMGGRFPSCGYVTIKCKNTNKQFTMGYSSPWDEEKGGYSKYDYEYKYCPLCGKLLKDDD